MSKVHWIIDRDAAVRQLEAVLNDRSGFQIFDLDADLRAELLNELVDAVLGALVSTPEAVVNKGPEER